MSACLLFVLLSACSRKAADRASGDAAAIDAAAPLLDRMELRESARETLSKNCGECHTRDLPTALPRALRVFDLTEADWARRMSADQLREAARRLSEPFAPTRGEGEVRPIQVSAEERARFDLYVAAELEGRIRDR
jgi:mono/diheme cytochrome c family protein